MESDHQPDDHGPEEWEATANAANARFFRVLGDPTRLAILQHLLDKPHSVSELIAKLGIAQSRVSNHLACLRWCRFVTADRVGRRVIYSAGDPRLRKLLDVAGEIASDNQDHLASCHRIGPDWI
jgi:ArsR family transcriptional regulator, cadmium/lead-responsive transcriptional repressor